MGNKNSSITPSPFNQEVVTTNTFEELKALVGQLKKTRLHGRPCTCNKFELSSIPMNSIGLDLLQKFLWLMGPDLKELKLSFCPSEGGTANTQSSQHRFVFNGQIFGKDPGVLDILQIIFPFEQLGELRQLPRVKSLRPQNCILTHESMEITAKETLESIMTSHCTVDLDFYHGCTNLCGLFMRDSRNVYQPKTPVVLPAMLVFQYQIPDVHKCDGRWCFCFETNSADAQVNLKEIVFFDKIEGQSWDLQNITSLQCDIEIFRSKKRIFNLNHAKGEIVSTLPILSQILSNLNGFAVQMLGWNGIVPKIEEIPINLKHLAVGINSKDGALDDTWLRSLLQHCTQLEELSLANGLGMGPHISTLDIAYLPRQLKCLTLKGIHLTYSPNVELDLDYFKYVNPLAFNSDILSNFSTIFKTRVLRAGMVQVGEGKTVLLDQWCKIEKGELMLGRASSTYRRPCTKFQPPPPTMANENMFVLNRNGEKSVGLFSTLSLLSAYEKDFKTNLTPFLWPRE